MNAQVSVNELGNIQICIAGNGREAILNLHPNNEVYCLTVIDENGGLEQVFTHLNPQWYNLLEVAL